MAILGTAGFSPLRYEPGNPEFPVLPDGILSLHIIDYASVPGFRAPLPVTNTYEKFAADNQEAYGDWYLDGIWRKPNPVDFGNITAAKQRQVTLHNSHKTSRSVTAVDMSAIGGLTLISPGLPVTLEAFDTVTFTFEAAQAGDNAFDADVIFTVSGVDLPVRMLGRRIIIFNMVPERPILERITWLSDHMISVEGQEQVYSVRQTPRSRVVLRQRLTNDQIRTEQQALVLGAGFLRMGVQLWWQARQVTAAALLTDLTIQVPTTSMETVAGSDVSFALPDGTYVEGEVDSLTASSITLSQQIGVALPLGTQVMPLQYGFQIPDIRFETFGVNVEDSEMAFDLIEYDESPNIDPAYFATHPTDGLPIVTRPLRFSGSTRSGGMFQNSNQIDGLTGDMQVFRDEAIARPRQDVMALCFTLADQHAWRQFLHSMRGSWGKFYLPTGTNDLPLNIDLSLGSNSFQIPSMGLESLIGNRAPRRDVMIEENGNAHYRRIASVSDNGTIETVTLDSTIPGSGTVPKEDVSISWLTLSRITGDVATFRHRRLGEAELRFSTRGVIV